MERLFLANGLRFICTPPRSQLSCSLTSLLSDDGAGWKRFSRTLGLQLLHSHQDANNSPSNINKKFKLPGFMNPSSARHLEDDERLNLMSELYSLDQYRTHTLRLLTQTAQLTSNALMLRHPRRNYSSTEAEFIRRLMSDPSITIKPADKNLGLALVDTAWYRAELKRMLGDKITYAPLPKHRQQHGKSIDSLQQVQEQLGKQLKQIATRHAPALAEVDASAQRFLTGAVTEKTAQLPGIYLLIKVHKPSGLCGRPIVPSHSWLTSSASQLADHLLQSIVQQANLSHIVRDTKSLVNEFEQLRMKEKGGVFLTADIASLYTNIDTKLGLRLIDQFLREQHVEEPRRQLIMTLLTFVMENSYLRYEDGVYHQIDGTAMGTSCAPIYANIIVYMLERPVMEEMGPVGLHLYRRFLDDVFAYVDANRAVELMHRLNSLHPRLKFEFTCSTDECAFLDLCIYKGQRFLDPHDGRFDLRVHQKAMNLYLYIPYSSFHPVPLKQSFITGELQRYIRNSSDRAAYVQLKHQFYQRLRDRGYPSKFLLPLFNGIYYDDRRLFLLSKAERARSASMLLQPPRSDSLLKQAAKAAQAAQSAHSAAGPAPLQPVFVIPYSPLTAALPIRQVLSRHWQLVRDAFRIPPRIPITAYQSQPNLLKQLVYTKAKRHEAERAAAQQPRATVQSSLLTFFNSARRQ